jgi:hypothetical protein
VYFQQPKFNAAYNAFELPIWLPNPQHGPNVFVWAQIRPTNAPRAATLQFKASGSSTWTTVAQLRATGAEGFVTMHVSLASAGGLRLSWTGPGNVVPDGRTAQVT